MVDLFKLDMKGQVCPIPAAETRNKLRSMSTGQILEVEGDFECSRANIENMAKKNGAEILSSEGSSNYYKVIMRKI